MSDRLEWRQEAAKGGGVDYVAGPFLIQDDLDNGGWTLRLDAVHAATLGEAQSLAYRILSVISDEVEVADPATDRSDGDGAGQTRRG